MRAIKFLVSKGVFLIILLISCVNNEVVGQIEKENIVLNPDDKKKNHPYEPFRYYITRYI